MNDQLKKILSGAGVLAAFGLGGAAIAGAQGGDKPADKPAVTQQAQPEASEQGEQGEADQKVTGADAERAGQAAVQSVGGGKVLEVERETPDQGTDKPEPGDKPDSAAEQAMERNSAYSVEVQKSDGTTVDVSLDQSFKVLGTEQEDEQGEQNEASEQDGEENEASEQAEAPAAQR